MRRLRARPDGQLPVRVLNRHRSMLLDREVRTALIKECVLKDFIRFGKSFFHISEFQGDLFVNVSFFAVFMNARLRGRQRLFGIGDGRENLVIHVNQIQRFKRC